MPFDPTLPFEEVEDEFETLSIEPKIKPSVSGFDPTQPFEEVESPEEQGILRQVADIPLGIARGGVTGIKMMTDILGADNPVSKSLSGVEGYMADLMSAQAKEDQQEISRIMKDAEDKGFGEQVKAGIKAFSIAPVDIMSQALGTMAPVIATGLAGSAAKLGALGMRAVQAGVGAGMGAGMIKGEIYNEVKNELVNSGIAEDAAEKAAVEAQSYGGKNLDQILLGAGLGAASTLGAEGIITRILTKQGTAPAAGVVSRVLKGGLTEAAPEAAQAAQEQLAKNVALQREGFDVDPSRGVVAAATMEAVAAAPLGGIAGAVERPAPIKTLAEENLEQTNEIARKVAENGAPLTASAIQDQASTNLRQDELAKQLEAQLEEELVAVKEPTAAPPAIKSKEEFTAIYSQVAPEELDAAEAGFTNVLATATTEEARANAQNALEAIKEVKATVTPLAPPVEPTITPAVTPAVTTAQPPITDATQEIIQPEGVRPELETGVEVPTPQAGVSRGVFDTTRGQEEGQVAPTTQPIISEIPPTSELVGAEPTQPTIREVPEISPIVGEEPSAIVEQEPVAPAEPKGTRVAAAAYIAPDGTEYTGPSHLAAMEQAKNEGKITQAEIDAKQSPESRETPQFGYKTDADPFVTRDQAEGIARQSGQLLVEKPATGQLHSNEVALDEFPKEAAVAPTTVAEASTVTEAPAAPEVKQVQTKDDFRKRFLAEEVTVTKDDPRFSKSTVKRFGLGQANVIEQKNLSEIVDSPSVFHETNLQSIRNIVSRIKQGPRNVDLWASNSLDLALGQGGNGYVIELDTQSVNGSVAKSLAANIMSGIGAKETEIKVNKTLPQSIKSIIAPSNAGVNALRKTAGFERLFDFDNATKTERGIRIPVKQKPAAAAEPAAPTPVTTPPVTEAVTPAPEAAPTPAGISVGNRVKSGRDPKVYVVEEVLPQTEAEQREGDYSVMLRDEKSGTIEKYPFSVRGLKSLGAKKPPLPKKLARSGATSYDFSPRNALAADQQISKEQIIANVQKVFEGVPAENIEVTNEPYPDGEYGYVAAYNPNTNKIEINQAYYTLDDDIDAKVSHELGHYLYQDPRWKKAFARLYKKLTPTSKNKLDAFLEQVYADYESGDFNEEAEIRAFDRFLKDAPDNRNLFQKFIDEILDFVTDALSVFSPYFKTLARDPRRIARNIALISSERFKSGEVIEGVDTTVEPEELRLARAVEPTEEAPAEEARREQFAGMKIGRIITTPPGITQKTTDIIRSKFFDSTKVSPENTSQAWAYISQFMDKTDNNNNKFAGYVNTVTELEQEPDFRVDPNDSLGAALLSIELTNYAARLAQQGDTKMLAYMIRNGNKMPTGEFAGGASLAGKVLNSFKERLGSDISGVAAFETEMKSNVERLAAKLFGTNAPSTEQIKIAQDALTESETIELGDANQVAADIKEVEGRTKTNLIDKVDAKISQAIDKSGRIKELEGKATRPRNIDAQAESVIESLQRSLGELPPLPQRRESDIRAIVKQDLRQNPDMGRREPWNNMLVGRLMRAGVSEEQAQTIADLTWKQHEQKAINRELKEMRKAAEEGSLAVIIDRIKNTSLERQQSPEWKQDVIKEYLRDAGLSSQAAETAAKLYDSVISERIASAKQKAFEDTLAKAAPWKNYASRNGKLAKDALKKIKEAIRTGVLDPEKNTESIIAALSGWTGFTKEQYQRIVELDTILNDPNQDDITKREAMDALNKIITKAKMPVRFKDALGAYYIGNALMGIPTALVNIASPLGFSIRNLMVDIAKYAKENPAKIPVAFETFLDSMRSWYNQTAYAFKNQIYLNDVVEYLNGQNVLRETFDKGKKQWAEGKYAQGFANIAVGMTQITGRVLSALDQGAISMLENQNITRYAMSALENAKNKVPKNKVVEFANMTLDLKRRVMMESIAAGMDKDRAGVLADLAVKSELRAALSEYGADTQSVLDSSINDALQAVGRNKVITINGIKSEQQKISDSGILSYWPIKMLEKASEGVGKEGSGMQIFAKMVFGFALVPARTFHTAAWFSPYGFLRLAIDKYKKNKGYESPYAMSVQTDAQFRQRLTESIAGSIAMLALFALRSGSSDDDEDKKFKIVITGNGPNATTDKQYYDSWIKKYKPYSVHIVVGDTVIPINIGRGGEALFFPIMLAGALDDYEIKKKQNLTKKEPSDLNIATEMLGSAFFALAQRGPYAAFTEPLFDASKQGRVTENLVSQLGYFGKTFVPVLGASITRNISDFINDPVDRSSIEGALYANTPVVGPWIGTKALNALGQPIRADDWGDKLYKLGVPVVFSFPKNTPENALNELILKQGSGPTLPTRANAQKRFGDVLTDKEFEAYVLEYGRVMSDKMFKNRTKLANMKAVDYDDQLEKYARGYSIDGIKIKGASDSAVLAVKRMRQ